jgi:hypothetical protein
MKNSLLILIATCVLLSFSIYGCASRPDEQIQSATEAMNQAIDLRAELYVPTDWKAAKDLWDQAQDQLAKSQYSQAKATLLTARARFVKARDNAKTERESLLKQVNDLQANLTANYAAFKSNKQASANKKDFQAACDDIDKRIGIIKEAVDKGDFLTAKTESQSALQAVDYNKKKLSGGQTSK